MSITTAFFNVLNHSALLVPRFWVLETLGPRALGTIALWSGTNKNRDVSTGSLAHSLPPLTRSLAPDCSLRLRPLLRSLIRSLAHFALSLARGKVIF